MTNSYGVGRWPGKQDRPAGAAFTLIELLVTIGVIAILAGLLSTAIAKAQGKAQGISCLGSVRQLSLASLLYVSDNADRLPYNLGGNTTSRGIAPRSGYNWVNNIMDWELNPDNTNTEFAGKGSFSGYVSHAAPVYRCPADRTLSGIQKQAGWSARVRSYSMNAMVGDAGINSRYGTNIFNPGYKQFKRLGDIAHPSDIFVFLDEHPDSINDGYFLNELDKLEWIDLPASYHNGTANFTFADGHAGNHRWVDKATKPPAQPDAAALPLPVEAARREDLDWVVHRTSVEFFSVVSRAKP
jgi:prepilin-type processing-associated H-X9-DG protein/prepilin-type N-terminal cleavage/methylation domain-containing protein